MSSDEFRSLLKAAYDCAIRCVSLARGFHRIVRCTPNPSAQQENKIIADLIGMYHEGSNLHAAGEELSKAFQEFGTISTGKNPIGEHERIHKYRAQLTGLVQIACGLSRVNITIPSDISKLKTRFKAHYQAIRRTLAMVPEIVGCFQSDLADAHNRALKDWVALSGQMPIRKGETKSRLDTQKKNTRVSKPRNLDELKRLQKRINKGERQHETKLESIRDFVETEFPKITTENAIQLKVQSLLRATNRYKHLL